MKYWQQAAILAPLFLATLFLILAGVDAGMMPGSTVAKCPAKFPKWFGCVLANHESLAGGLIGAGGALFAAWLAWHAIMNQIAPVWAQLAELRRQSNQRTYEFLRQRSVELENERVAIYQITSSMQLMSEALLRFRSENTIAGLSPAMIANVTAARDYLRESIEKFQKNPMPFWGDAATQSARRDLLDAALRFANGLEPFMSRLVPNNRLSNAEVDRGIEPVAQFKTAAFAAGAALHRAVDQEVTRVGTMISRAEPSALS